MARHLALSVLLVVIAAIGFVPTASASVGVIRATADYSPAYWVPANPANYTVSDRPHGYQVNMIVVHDIEGSVDSAIAAFQDPNRAGSAHYIVGQAGGIWQMVMEKDIAWHAGNWDYNTRAIGIEHEGFACCNYYTTAEYDTSAHLIASICSRWGVPLDRTHVIAHSEVPDPNNPGLFGGAEHHTDPGSYWDWSYYLGQAQFYASTLPSPPHMGPDPVATSERGGAMLTWQPAQSCRKPITGYQVVSIPAGVSLTLPAGQTSVWIPGLTDGTSYKFTVTATNADGQSSLTSNTVIPSTACSGAHLSTSAASPQPVGSSIVVSATSTGCTNPEYEFWLRSTDGTWAVQKDYSTSATWTWNTAGMPTGTYELGVWVRQVSSAHGNDSYAFTGFVLGGGTCASASLAPGAAPPQPVGTVVTFAASSTGCSAPEYQFWLMPPGGGWTSVRSYASTSTWSLDSSKYPAGNFQVGVWAKQLGSINTYDSFYVMTYWIRSGAGCVVSALNSAPAPPQGVGASAVFAVQQSGCAGQYKFWLLPPGGSWRVVQGYGAPSSWTWNTVGYSPGVYEVGAWEGSSSTPSAYASYAITTFTLGLAACGSTTLSSDAAPPQPPGTTVTFTAGSTGCPAPSYEFWLRSLNATWTVQRGYGGASWSWNTSGLPAGTYQVGVWARQSGSTAAYDAYFIETYRVVGPACTSATLGAAPASPQPAGTQVTFTASSSGCSSPAYQFLEQSPGGGWTVVRPFSSTATLTWDSTGSSPGTYRFAVWALAQGSAADYDSYGTTSYTVT